MKKFFWLVLFCTGAFSGRAQSNTSSAEIYLGLRKLNVLGTVLYVAAHPDDENTRLLTYFSKDKLFRTGYLSITRGDGGQNLIGDEQGIELGLIRTQELLAARRIDGAEQFFTRAYDFGYSKTPTETFQKWGHEKILADVVWVIRRFQPEVIITRFPTTGEGGHGHHTASGILANEAFAAAADVNKFPEQLQYVKPWQAKRIVWNTFNFGGNNTTSNEQAKFDVGGYNPVLGKSYGEIAADSRSQHKSQGFGVPRTRGEAMEFFRATGGATFSNDLFEDVKTDWRKVGGGSEVAALINAAIAGFDFLQPQKSVPALVQIYKALKNLPDGYWRNQKLKETAQLIEQASGLFLDATTTVQNAVQGDSLRINFALNNRSGSNVLLEQLSFETYDSTFNTSLSPNKNLVFAKTFFIQKNKPLTQPYWLKHKKDEGAFTVNDQQLIGVPDVAPAFTANFTLNIAGEKLVITKPVFYKMTDPVKGELYKPVFVVPPVTVYVVPEVVLFQKDKNETKSVDVFTSANKALNSEMFKVKLRSKFYDKQQASARTNFLKNAQGEYNFVLDRGPMANNDQDNLYPLVDYGQDSTQQNGYLSMTTINYDHIPTIKYFYADPVKLLNIDLKIYNKKIGYIVGAGDRVPEALTQMGYDVTLLTQTELARNNLQQFDAIISGVRAYNTNEWLNNYYDKLMRYVAGGGNLITQYNTSNQVGPVRAKIGPYAFNISRNRITDENAVVSFLQPNHPVLNYPNKISEDDFKGWVQERSIYHANNFDTAYKAILRMNDEGETGDDGSLIIAKHGKGYFTYTGLVFFRELPAGVPGAYRLLANMIALNRKKEM